MKRQPLYSLLNISALGIGIGTALIILLYMQFELTFDAHNKQADRIYRIETTKIHTVERVIDVSWGGVPGNLAPLIQQDYPQIQSIMRVFPLFRSERIRFELGDKQFQTDEIYAADSNVVEIFSFDWIQGNPAKALTSPNSIVLSESLALQIFGEADPLGQILRSPTPVSALIEGDLQLIVTAVYKDWPDNSHWRPKALISATTDPGLGDAYFNSFNFSTYVLLNPAVQADTFARKLSSIYGRYLDPQREPVLKKADHRLLPLLQIHFDETEGQDYLYTFGAIGLLLLLIALISYVNLTIAQSSREAKEIGLRKVLGSSRQQLLVRYFGESFLFIFLAFLVGILLVNPAVLAVNYWLGLSLAAGDLWQIPILIGMLCIFVGMVLLGGAYPALYLSSFQPVDVIRGKDNTGKHRIPIRTFLVGLQFVVVLFVLVSTGMISTQLTYMRDKDLGFEQRQMVAFELPPNRRASLASLTEQLEESPRIARFCQTSFLPGGGNMIRGPLSVETPEGPQQENVRRGQIDEHFLETMDIQLVEGRAFSPAYPTDTTQSAIVNQTFVRHFGLEDVLGTKVRLGGQGNPNFMRIIGVIEDYHESSLHSPIQPQLYRFTGRRMGMFMLQLEGNPIDGTEELAQIWQQHFPEIPFDLYVLNEVLQEEYESDQIRAHIFFAFSLITICIAFLGLFGLASFLTAQRTKEIGIRKVLGANRTDLLLLMTKPFLYLLLLAALPGFGFGWWFLQDWLENFAFRTDMNIGLFVLVWVSVCLFTVLISGYHALKTASINPVDALRDE
ncbi:MAG: ABC transporter permease [Bacteroidota bacterium]